MSHTGALARSLGSSATASTLRERFRLLTGLSGLPYLAVTVFARLPLSMLPLGTLVMVAAWSRQLLVAGYAAGTVAMCTAATVPIYGILARRLGQRTVLLFCLLLNTVSIVWLIAEAVQVQAAPSSNLLGLLLACAAAGATCAPVAALARIRWSRESQRLSDRTLLNSSLAFESVADVLALVLGAALTGLGSVFWHPHAGLLLVMAVNVLAVPVFAFFGIKRTHVAQFRPQQETEDRGTQAARRQLMWLPVLGMGALGLLLGSMQSALVAYTSNFDAVEYVGLLYAVLGISSLVAALIVVALRVRTSTWGAWLLWACLLTLVGLPASMPGSTGTLVISLVAQGMVVGVSLIVTDSVVMAIAPIRYLDVVMTAALASLLGGLALGLAWGSVLSDSMGYGSALMLPLLSAGAYLLLAHGYGYLWRRRFEDRLERGHHGAHAARD